MNWLAVIAAFFKIVLAWWMEKKERDANRKRIFKEAKNQLKKGLRSRDTSEVFDAWDRVNRNRR